MMGPPQYSYDDGAQFTCKFYSSRIPYIKLAIDRAARITCGIDCGGHHCTRLPMLTLELHVSLASMPSAALFPLLDFLTFLIPKHLSPQEDRTALGNSPFVRRRGGVKVRRPALQAHFVG
eukprot:765551-Hanusia_phi.AAC.4